MTGERSDFLPRMAGILWILLLAAAGVAMYEPRGVVPETAPAKEFSAERAMRHVREIGRAPHPAGTAEHARVRDYLLEQLSALGLEPSIQKTVGMLAAYGAVATVENVVARKRGSTGTVGPAVLLVAHYDSVPAGPGAGDDGAGAATLLETARALAAGPPLRDDVIFLFSDGEEMGLLGASAFVAEHPWKNDAAVVLNFDNRGTRGPVLMYETSGGNLALVRELAGAVAAPRASSLSAAVAQLMPNSSDFYCFRKAGMAGLNFAFIGGPERYHTARDTPANLDLRTLQQAGSYALPLARRLANSDLSRLARTDGPDAVYFNPAGGWEIVYPMAWARGLGISVLVLFLGVAGLGLAKRAIRAGGVLLGFVLCAVSLLAAWRAGDWMAVSLPRLHSGSGTAGPYLYHPIYAAALYCLVAGITFAIWEIGKLRWEEIALAGAGAWTVLGVATAFRFPAASYLGVWPVVPVLVGLGIVFAWRPGASNHRGAAAEIGVAWAGIVPGVLLVAPLLPLLHLALGMSTMGAPAQAVLVALSVWLVAPVLAPRGADGPVRGARIALIFLAAGAAVFVIGLRTVRYDDQHPRPEWIAYVQDADRATAQWFSQADANAAAPGARVDPWRSQYLTAKPLTTYFPVPLPWRSEVLCWAQTAPLVELDPPAAAVLSEIRKEHSRVLSIRLRSPRHAARLSIEAEAQQILSLRVNGRDVGERRVAGVSARAVVTHGGAYRPREQREVWSVLYAAPPDDGLEITITLPEGAPLALTVADISDGLPGIPGHTFLPRPPSVTQQLLADMTVVIKSFTF